MKPGWLLFFLMAASGAALCLRLHVPAESAIRFVNSQPSAHVPFMLQNGSHPDKPIIDSVLGGVALLDYDNDGYLDIYFTNGAAVPSLVKESPSFLNRLYHNNRDGTFTDVTDHAGVGGIGYNMGVAAADYDNDGFTDLYVTGVNRNVLYHNNGNGTFTDVTAKADVGAIQKDGRKPWSTAAVWIDYDNDGLLDLFVVNYLDWSWAKNRVCGDPGHRLSCSPETYLGQTNFLYHNNGDGTFTDVSETAGLAAFAGKGMSAAVADYDSDGFTDIYVTNDKEANFLLHNEAGKRFTETAIESGAGFNQDGVAVSSMGVDFRDIDNTGRPAVVVTALAGETFLYFFNNDGHFFSERSYQVGLGFPSLKMSGWGVGAFDFDNDGNKDIFTANSHASENAAYYGPHPYRQSNAVFRNRGDGTFEDVSRQCGSALSILSAHRGAAFGDIDNDGKVDAVTSSIGSPSELLLNRSTNQNHWILIRTLGVKSNRDGIGTRIKLISSSGKTQYNQVTTAVGYASSSDKRVHFGLGPDTRIRELDLYWPSGVVQQLKDVAVDRILTVTEK